MNQRRSFNLSLPASDPNSARILAWLDAQPADADIARLMRQLLVTGLDVQGAVSRIEEKLDLLASRTLAPAAEHAGTLGPVLDDEVHDAVAALLDFSSIC